MGVLSVSQADSAPATAEGSIHFAANDGFLAALRRRVDDYFKTSGRRPRDCPAMYRKTAIILSWLAASYALLVFVAWTWWLAVPLVLSLSLAMAAVGFSIQHDGGHQAYSNYRWVNRLMAMTMDLIGGSSYLWRWKHHVIHHTYVNITGHDDDINLGPIGRLTPHQRRFFFHRFQHWYLWLLYGLTALNRQYIEDFKHLLTGRIGSYRIPRPRGWNLGVFVGGKATFIALALVIPMLLHPVWIVLLAYCAVLYLLGVTLAVVFQLAHAVEEAAFPLAGGDTGRMDNPWAVHQVETTVDFSQRSRVATWLLGGLNFQIEHHLFPRICHVNYPALAPLVRQTCREFGLRYAVHDTFLAGIASHYRWLRRLGRPATA
jgi:linoleoyl-CoA desaturase